MAGGARRLVEDRTKALIDPLDGAEFHEASGECRLLGRSEPSQRLAESWGTIT
jgi:hypothetical protein